MDGPLVGSDLLADAERLAEHRAHAVVRAIAGGEDQRADLLDVGHAAGVEDRLVGLDVQDPPDELGVQAQLEDVGLDRIFDAWLREAIRLSQGTQGLEQLAREEGKHRPHAYLDWFAVLEQEGKRREILVRR